MCVCVCARVCVYRLTDLPDTYASLPMVDLFLSENDFTTVPKAVLGQYLYTHTHTHTHTHTQGLAGLRLLRLPFQCAAQLRHRRVHDGMCLCVCVCVCVCVCLHVGMKQLSKLSLACCKLTQITPDLGKVISLRFLDLSFNMLETLPDVSVITHTHTHTCHVTLMSPCTSPTSSSARHMDTQAAVSAFLLLTNCYPLRLCTCVHSTAPPLPGS